MTPVARRSCAAAVVAATFLTACGPSAARVPTVSDPIRRTDPQALIVASFDFPESEVLANVYADVLQSRGYPARVMENVGARELVEPALYRGLVDLVPEYTGSALAFLSLGADNGTASTADTWRACDRPCGVAAWWPWTRRRRKTRTRSSSPVRRPNGCTCAT